MGLTTCRSFWGAILDEFLILFVVFPLAIFHWRGTWHLQDVYILPDDEFTSSWISLAIGSVAGILLAIIKPYIFDKIKHSGKPTFIVVSRIYLYFNGWAILGYWRGSWNLVDHYLGEEWLNSLVLYVVAEIVSLFLRTARTNDGLPLSLQVDTEEELLKIDTRYQTKPSKMGLFVLDILLTQFVIVTCNMLVWRGIWDILDACLYPEDKFTSDVVSLVLGYISVISLFLLQFPTAYASARLDGKHIMYKLVFEGVFTVVGAWYIMLMWRGAWDLVRDYVIPNKLVGGWVCHITGDIGLMLLGVYSNVGTNGIDIDGSYMEGTGMYPLDFTRDFFSNFFSQSSTVEKVALNGVRTRTEDLLYDADLEISSDDEETKKLVKLLSPVS